jgi:NAD-dependent SIR2 family protein deacetylase
VNCGSSRRDFSLPVVRQCSCGETLRPDIVWFGDWLDKRPDPSRISAEE